MRDAIIAFLRDPKSAGLGVGMQYFPLMQPGVPGTCEMTNACNGYGPCDILNICSAAATVMPCQTNADCRGGQGTCVRLGVCNLSGGACTPAGTQYLCTHNNANDYCAPIAGYCDMRDRCDSASYATPAVEVATLPGAATALVASLNGKMPDGLTPTSGALSGAVMHAQALARANPTHKVVVLLATDGLPSECDPNDIAGVAAIAATALAGTPSISTYVIGVFAPAEMADAQTNLDAIAAAGGTGRAFVISTGNANVTSAFVAALNSVRSSGLSCQYEVPTATGGRRAARLLQRQRAVHVRGAARRSTIGNVKDRATAAPTKGGWYYDVDREQGRRPRRSRSATPRARSCAPTRPAGSTSCSAA